MSVKIILDSTADITDQIKSRCTVVPLTVRFGEEEYLDGVTITHKEFYEKLAQCTDLPTTSQPTPDSFARVFQQVIDAGDQAVVLTISSKLSGTYQSACIAAMDFPNGIFVVDTKTATIGAGVMAELALSLADSGMEAEQIAERLTALSDKVRLVAMLDTLEYLKRGGRISKAAAFAGELLSIKPLISILDGQIQVTGKARGARQANTMLLTQIEKADVDFSLPIMTGHTGNSDALMKKFLESSEGFWSQKGRSLPYTLIGSVIGTHAGPDAFAIAFFTK